MRDGYGYMGGVNVNKEGQRQGSGDADYFSSGGFSERKLL